MKKILLIVFAILITNLFLYAQQKPRSPKVNVIYVHRKLDSTIATDDDFEYYKGKEYACGKMTAKAMSFLEKNKKTIFLYLPFTLPHLSLQVPDEYIEQYTGQFNEHPYYGQNGYASTKYPFSTYAAMITYLDDQVGIILKKLTDLGLEKNSLVMFSSEWNHL